MTLFTEKGVNFNRYTHERQEKKILKLRAQLEEAQDQYDKLIQEKKEADKKKLFAAYSKSKRSLDEVLDFLKGKADI